MGEALIIIGIAIWYAWGSDFMKGEKDPSYKRAIHNHPIGGCIPFIIAFALIGIGIYLLVS